MRLVAGAVVLLEAVGSSRGQTFWVVNNSSSTLTCAIRYSKTASPDDMNCPTITHTFGWVNAQPGERKWLIQGKYDGDQVQVAVTNDKGNIIHPDQSADGSDGPYAHYVCTQKFDLVEKDGKLDKGALSVIRRGIAHPKGGFYVYPVDFTLNVNR
jgi:hypothetical protein